VENSVYDEAMPMTGKRRALLAGLLAVGIVLGALASMVDDWGRDFTTNFAELSDHGEDLRLRPVELERSPEVVVAAIKDAARRLGNWEVTGEASGGGAVALSLVRTTPVFRFKDDVTLRVADLGGGSRITGDSRSRVGKGDLGQNPRNLIEILDETRAVLEARETP
jgi:uncharacterized protein (DUF1499 family)